MTTTTIQSKAVAPILTHTRLPGVDYGTSVTGRYAADSSRSDQLELVERPQPLAYFTAKELQQRQQRMLKRVLAEGINGLSSWSLLPDISEDACMWDGQDMYCPVCGGNNLHQVAVVPADPAHARITIAFMCEHCPAEPHLHLAQHKGITSIFWDAEMLLKDFGIYDDAVAAVLSRFPHYANRLK